MTVHVTIAMDEAVKAKLDALAAGRGVPVDEVIAYAVEDMTAAEDAFLAAVDEGLKSIAEGRVHDHADVVAAVEAQRAARAAAR
ncbi:hypothetical protein BH09PSE1_BH09PSE1_18750 [soil metagenome]